MHACQHAIVHVCSTSHSLALVQGWVLHDACNVDVLDFPPRPVTISERVHARSWRAACLTGDGALAAGREAGRALTADES